MRITPRKKFKEFANANAMIEQRLLQEASVDESWNNTMDRLMYYYGKTPEIFMDLEFLEKTVSYFSEEAATVGEGLDKWIQTKIAFEKGAKEILASADPEFIKEMNPVLNLGKLKRLSDLDREMGVSKNAINFFMLVKAFSLVVNNYDKLVKLIREAAKEDLIQPEVLEEMEAQGTQLAEKQIEAPKLRAKFQNVTPAKIKKVASPFGHKPEEETESKFAKRRRERIEAEYETYSASPSYFGGRSSSSSIFGDRERKPSIFEKMNSKYGSGGTFGGGGAFGSSSGRFKDKFGSSGKSSFGGRGSSLRDKMESGLLGKKSIGNVYGPFVR